MISRNHSIAFIFATISAIVNAQGSSDTVAVRPWDDIAATIDSDAVDNKATFTISASHLDFGQNAILPPNVEASIDETTFSFDVNIATSAVTPETLIRDEEGNLVRMGELAYSLLVPSNNDRTAGTVALISVDHKTGETNGIVQRKDSQAMHIRQKKGRSIVAEEEAEFVPPAWSCTVAEEHEDDPIRHRHLEEHAHDHEHDHNHHHEHSHHHHHEHDHDHGLDGHDLPGSFEHLRKSLRGTDVSKIGKRRELQDNGVGYSYQVDLYIEFDQELVDINGGLQQTYNYINALTVMANQIYEHEVDTHLNIVQMEQTNDYNKMKKASDGLAIMKKKWEGSNWSNDQVDLHHMLSGKDLGGGIAYVGVICNKNYGFGVSTSISGSFTSMNAGVTWDSMVYAHEIGHNFSSGHTFSGYSPVVDQCMQNRSCPKDKLEDNSATLMSYCHMCGGFGKVEYTFGGEYDGSGAKNLLSNWKKSDKLGDTRTSKDPQRVPHKMHLHVSSRGSCVSIPAPQGPTPKPTPTPTRPPSPPTTPRPTYEPEIAEYDEELGAPKCSGLISHCKSGDLLVGRGSVADGVEANRPNTLDDCVDGNEGTYEDDESVEKIEVKTVSGNMFEAGEEVEISVEVYAYRTGSKDYLDLWYAADANDPEWEYITTMQPSSGGFTTISATYTLPESSTAQAVRAVFRYSQSGEAPSNACPGGGWTDVDDISFFTVESLLSAGVTSNGDGNAQKDTRTQEGGKKKKKRKHHKHRHNDD